MSSTAGKLSHGPRYDGTRVSREEYLDLEEDGYQYDMIGGVLHVSPSGDFEHGRLAMRFGFLLMRYLTGQPAGQVVSEVDVLLPDGGDVLRPDVSFLFTENLPAVKTHIHGAPDLICEVLSPRTRARDLGDKASRYLSCGVKEYWIVDPAHSKVEAWINDGAAWEKRVETPVRSAILDGFEVEPNELFDS